MKSLLILLFLVNQFGIPVHSEYPDCTNKYFKNGKISTAMCFDKDHRFGKAWAYDQSGKIIYERELRDIGGHSSVWFTYYPNGAVQKAEWSSAPDGGIQWYRNISTFSEDGKLLSSFDRNYDDSPALIFRPK